MNTSSTSSSDPALAPAEPFFNPNNSQEESTQIRSLIQSLNLQPHPQGGYHIETDRDAFRIPNPSSLQSTAHGGRTGGTLTTTSASDLLVASKAASSTAYHLLTPQQPLCAFRRNSSRTVHSLHKGRGRYVVIHADEGGHLGGLSGQDSNEGTLRTDKVRVETFVVGQNIAAGEKLQWITEAGKYTAYYLLPDEEGGQESSQGLLVSETCVPGFEWTDHDGLTEHRLEALVTTEQKNEMAWLLKSPD